MKNLLRSHWHKNDNTLNNFCFNIIVLMISLFVEFLCFPSSPSLFLSWKKRKSFLFVYANVLCLYQCAARVLCFQVEHCSAWTLCRKGEVILFECFYVFCSYYVLLQSLIFVSFFSRFLLWCLLPLFLSLPLNCFFFILVEISINWRA